MATNSVAPLVVIVGPTASGKTALAIEAARQFGGEIICADSRTVYKHMNVGTAKPSLEERSLVPHWGLDIAEPGQHFSVADFKKYAESKIQDIRSRGRTPFLVGGSGLYIDAILFDYQFGPAANPERRAELESKSPEELYEYCVKNNIKLPENHNNKRYVIRAIEQKSINTKRKNQPVVNSIIVGIATNKDILRARIQQRTEQLFDDGVVEEATLLGEKYGWSSEAMTGNIYPILHDYLEGRLTLNEAKEKNTTQDWRLAKRQLTWFRRDPFIQWMSRSEAKSYLFDLLAKE